MFAYVSTECISINQYLGRGELKRAGLQRRKQVAMGSRAEDSASDGQRLNEDRRLTMRLSVRRFGKVTKANTPKAGFMDSKP